jgi:predicted nuclease with TOPRIM domain
MSQPEHERRTVQNTNDILSIYDMLSEMDSKLDNHTVQLANLGSRLDAHDARFDQVDARLEKLDTNLEEVLRRLPG